VRGPSVRGARRGDRQSCRSIAATRRRPIVPSKRNEVMADRSRALPVSRGEMRVRAILREVLDTCPTMRRIGVERVAPAVAQVLTVPRRASRSAIATVITDKPKPGRPERRTKGEYIWWNPLKPAQKRSKKGWSRGSARIRPELFAFLAGLVRTARWNRDGLDSSLAFWL
jgi:hypothetical protein